MNPEKEKKRDLLVCLAAMLIVFIPKALMIGQALPVRTLSDEAATVSGAAYAAGYDWSAVVSHAGYYGQGFYILFWWVFRLTDNPILIQHTILYICAALQSLTVPIVFHIARKHFHIKSRGSIFLLAVLAGYLTVTRVLVLYNENILNLYVWVIVAVWMEAIDIGHVTKNAGFSGRLTDTRQQKSLTQYCRVWDILLCALLGWSLAIHLRMAALILAFLVMEIAVSIDQHIHRYSYKTGEATGRRNVVCIVVLCISVVGALIFNRFVQERIWKLQEGQTLRNTSFALRVNADWKNLTYLKAFLGIIFGQINTYQVFCCGLGMLGVILLAVFLKRTRIVKKSSEGIAAGIGNPTANERTAAQMSRYRKDDTGEKDESEEIRILRCKVCLVGGTLLIAIAGTILAQAVSWGNGVYSNMAAGRIGNVYSYKAFTYIRYFGIYAGPFTVLGLLCGCWLLKNVSYKKRTLLRVLLIDSVILTLLQVAWFAIPQKYLGSNWYARETFIPFAGWYRGKVFSQSPYLYGIVFLGTFFAVTVLLCRWKKYNVLIGAAAAVLMAEYIITGFYFDFADERYEYNKVNDSWRYLSNIEANLKETAESGGMPVVNDEHSDNIKGAEDGDGGSNFCVYCCDMTGRSDHNSWYLLQFYLPEWKVIPIDPDESIASGIVQTNRADYNPVGDTAGKLDIPYERLVLDGRYGEYIYLVGQEAIEEFGAMPLHPEQTD